MGDDRNDGGVYKFVSDYEYRPGRRTENLRILTSGKLYVARWEPGGRRTFDAQGNLLSVEEGTGTWREVAEAELVDTHARISAAEGADWNAHFATNRPEDVEVGEDGTVWIALTNNSAVNDVHGSVRTLQEADGDATSLGPFTWQDYAPGGQDEAGFSCPDNLVFDKAGNTWVVTDISSGSLNGNNAYQFHANNAVFMVPGDQPEGEVKAFRFANMPVQSEGTGPYFTPDEKTLFVNVQHPGESSGGDPADPANWTSYWPKASKTAGATEGPKPIPSTVQITKLPKGDPPVPPVIPPPETPQTPPPADTTKPDVDHVSSQIRKLSGLRHGAKFTFEVDEPGELTVTLSARLRKSGRKAKGRGKLRRLARRRVAVTRAGDVSVTLRPNTAVRALLRRERELPATLKVVAVDAAGNRTARTIRVLFR